MSSSGDESKKIREFVWVAQPVGRPVYAVLLVYEETDAINAVGQIHRMTSEPTGDGVDIVGEASLNTNDGLANIWASPEGNLWVGSTSGNVWTTADVKWDTSKIPDIEWSEMDTSYKWKGMALPRSREKTRYNVAVMAGSSDRDVYAATFEGDILRWDGMKWSVSYAENTKPIQRMHGTGPDNLWAVGRDSLVLHYDGHHWHSVPLPGDEGDENLTGVWALSKKEVYICSTAGAVFHGSQHGLERLGDYKHEFYGITEYKKDMLLAAGEDGVCTLQGNKIKVLNGKFAAVGVYRLPERLAFAMADEGDEPTFIVYDPSSKPVWCGWSL